MDEQFNLPNKQIREILQWLKKIGAVYLIKSYGGEGRKYLEIPWVKYLVLPKCGTESDLGS